MDEDKKDLKEGEDTSFGDGQPGKTNTGLDSGAKKADEDTVNISKADLEKLQTEKENYRLAVIRLNKDRGRTLPGTEPDKKPKPSDDDGGDDGGDSADEFVTRKELLKRDDQAAINEACKNPEIDEYFNEILVYYIPPADKTYEAKLTAIQKAHKVWSATDKPPEKPVDPGKKITQDLATDTGVEKGKEKDTKPPSGERHIIPKKEKMTEWYK